MSFFGNLFVPNELILYIISHVRPGDIESFASCNKAIYGLSQDTILEHRLLKQCYATICLNGFGTGTDSGYTSVLPLVFLGQILSDPKIAYYPSELLIEDCWIGDPSVNQEAARPDVILDKVISSWKPELEAVVARNHWLLNTSQCAQWHEALLEDKNEECAISILLTVLPHLKRIVLKEQAREPASFADIITAIAEANRDTASPLYRKALSKLQSLELNVYHNHPKPSLSAIFAALPSLRSLYTKRLVIEGGEGFEGITSDIQEIQLIDSFVDATTMESMMRSLKSLKSFRYVNEYYAASETLNAPGIIAFLTEHASQTLERLDLRTAPRVRRPDDLQWIEHLKCFTKLKTLRIDDRAFHEQVLVSGEQIAENAKNLGVELEKVEPEYWIWDDERDVIRLVDVLPASITHVALVRTLRSDGVRKLFEGLTDEKERRVPALETIILEGQPGPVERQ